MKKEKFYRLQIYSKSDVGIYNAITKILEVEPNRIINVNGNLNTEWIYEVAQKQSEEEYDFVTHFLEILEGKYDRLEEIGVRNSITFYCVFDFEQYDFHELEQSELDLLDKHRIGLGMTSFD
jgi:hypothetical protein